MVSFFKGISHENNFDRLILRDSIPADTIKEHSPKKAALFSAIIPGAGQLYNAKYETKKWYAYAKIGAIWGGGFALIYFLNFNHQEYLRYKTAYIYRLDQDASTIDEFAADPRYTIDVIKNERDSWRKYRDYCAIGFIGLYFLNIVEASVTAHFWDYDISEDLSMRVRPSLFYNQMAGNSMFSLSLTFNLK